MAKEVLLYGRIDSEKAELFHESLQEIEGNDEMMLRINTIGGSPEYGWGVTAMWNEIKTPKKIRVDGQAHSFGAFMLCYTENTEAVKHKFCLKPLRLKHRNQYRKYYHLM